MSEAVSKAEQRRQKLLARGTSRLEQITGDTLLKQDSKYASEEAYPPPPQQQPTSKLPQLPTQPTTAASEPINKTATSTATITPRGTEAVRIGSAKNLADLDAKTVAAATAPPLVILRPYRSQAQRLSDAISMSSFQRTVLAVVYAVFLRILWEMPAVNNITSTTNPKTTTIALSKEIERTFTAFKHTSSVSELATLSMQAAATYFALLLNNTGLLSWLFTRSSVVLLLLEALVVGVTFFSLRYNAAENRPWERQPTSLHRMLALMNPDLAEKLPWLTTMQNVVGAVFDTMAAFVVSLVMYTFFQELF